MGISSGNTKKKENLNNSEELKKYIENLKQNNIDIDILYDKNYKYDNYINILLNLKEEPKAISFLLEKNIDNCNNMENIVGDDDNTLINIKDINDLKKCVEFKNNLGYNVETKDKDFFKLFKENVEKNKDIEIYFTRYVNTYNDLNKLFQNTFDKSATSKQIIISICANSVFI